MRRSALTVVPEDGARVRAILRDAVQDAAS